MKTQNPTNDTPSAFGTRIAVIAAMAQHASLPQSAANESPGETGEHHMELAEEASYWMVVSAAFGFQLLLVNLLTAI